jgi:DNA-binding response OmpR family regulator
MSQKTVLIVDDEEEQRNALHQGLEWRNFEVASAGDVATARSIVMERNEPFDVVVLDMQLKDPNKVTGGDLGIEFRRRWLDWPPEFLIVSAHNDNPDYFKLALQMGAAAYLEKQADIDFRSVIRHVQVLALRRALSIERPDALEKLKRIAMISRSKAEATRRFCDEVLRVELQQTLGSPFVLLLTSPAGTHCFTNRSNLPTQMTRGYEIVQALAQGRTGRSEPLLFRADWAHEMSHQFEESETFRRLAGAAFIPLSSEDGLRLSLGILPSDQQDKQTEDPSELARVLENFFRPAVLKHLLTLTTTLTEMNARRLAVLTTTSQFCLYVGQEQLTSLDSAIDSGEIDHRGSYLQNMQNLAEDLCNAGAMFNELARRSESTAAEAVVGQVSMKDVTEAAWSDISRMLDGQGSQILFIYGDCLVLGRRDYLTVAIARILQWFAQRLSMDPLSGGEKISVWCQSTEQGPEIVFEDKSRRLTESLRKRLFFPFAEVANSKITKDFTGPGTHLPLYMAKTLVEFGNWGCLEDRTPEMHEGLGHRFVMQFPSWATTLEASVP